MTDIALSAPSASSISVARAPLRARLSWVMFDWSAQPFYTLVLTFLFAPYFANAVASSGAEGQALWGYAAAAAGLLIAIGSPLLGAMADGGSRRKPWIALFSLIFIGAVSALWLAVPGASFNTILLVLAAFVVAMVAIEFATVFTNAMMPGLAPNEELGRLSGLGYAVGYAGGLVSLAVMMAFLIADPTTGKTIANHAPIIPLNAAEREGERLIGAFAAVWFVIFMIPFFLFVPDRKPVGGRAHGTAMSELWSTVKTLPEQPSMLLFLVARMLYADALAAIFTFGGIYGTSLFNWSQTELGIFGIAIISIGVLGALIGGWLDDKLGSKTVIVGGLILLIIALAGILSVDRTHVLYTIDVAQKDPAGGHFSSVGEWVYMGFAILVGIVAAPIQAASRTLLARLAPPDKVTQFFGLFAFSGKATAFLAPLLVGLVIGMSGDQRLGMASITVFLVLGMVLMLPVRTRR
ncbi:MAG: MFS transporter [Hyphomicrobiaceae bacterium]|nr:MFS transporter [Hyphomicrobiaceae bacterium]